MGVQWIILKTSVGLVLFGAMVASAEDAIPFLYPPPPPPPRVEERKAAPPQRIRVGGQVQAVGDVRGPGTRWAWVLRLTQQQLEECERKLHADPNDVQTRGLLIAALRNVGPQSNMNVRLDHLLWMIQHRPDWDGFLLEPHNSVTGYLSEEERVKLKVAWLDQVNLNGHRGIVLHNAAMFFAIREPERAAVLLGQAIAIEPKELLHVERLGMIYAYPLLDSFAMTWSLSALERVAFAQQAENVLALSNNWIVLRGAASILVRVDRGRRVYPDTPSMKHAYTLGKDLFARADALSTERELPSESPRFQWR
jgi:hypothetical protein